MASRSAADPVARSRADGRPPRRMAPARRREHLISTALSLYGRCAPEEVSVEAIVAEADVSRALFYRYFSSIGDMHVAALSSVVDELIRRISTGSDGDTHDRLRTALSEFVTVVRAYADSYVALLRSGSAVATSDTDALIDRVRDHVVALVLEWFEVADPTPMLRTTLRGWVAVVESTLLTWLRDPDPPREQLESWLIDQLRAMVTTTARHDPATAEQLGDLVD